MKVDRELVLVAGGAGFLGSHLIDALLSDGTKVVCVDNFRTGLRRNLPHLEREPRFDLVDADVIQPLRKLARRPITAIYNLACAASPPHYRADTEHTMLTSVVGTRNLLALAEATRSRFLLASTSDVYGVPDQHPQTETYWGNVNPTGPRACYDEGKRAAESLTFDYARAKRGEIRVARIFNTYGPRMRMDDGRAVSNIVSQALRGDEITIYGDGSQTRSFCYVTDMVQGLIKLMNADGVPGPVNLGNPGDISVNDLAARVVAMTGSSSRIVHRSLPQDDPLRRRPDITLAETILGWAPDISLDEGLRQTITWFEGEMDRERREPVRSRDMATAVSV
jgi:UDP-glucuronate decarboxylase